MMESRKRMVEISIFSIHSGYFYSASSTTQKRSQCSMDTVPEFHAKAPQATAIEGPAQGPYVAAGAGF